MNEQYLQGYFDTYVKPSRPDANYQDWLLKIKDNEQYKRGMFDSNVKVAKPDATYEDWNSKVFGSVVEQKTPLNTFIQKAGDVVSQFNRGASEFVPAILKTAGAVESLAYKGMENLGLGKAPESLLSQAGEVIQGGIETINPVSPEFEQSTTGQVVKGVGQVVPFLATMGGSGAGQVAAQAPKVLTPLQQGLTTTKAIGSQLTSKAGVIGGSQVAAPEWEAAKEAGLSDEEAFGTLVKNYFVGQTEVLPIQNWLSMLNKVGGGKLFNLVKTSGISGMQEAIQESFQTYLTNRIAAGSYDPDRDPLFQTLESAKVGGIVGLIVPSIGNLTVPREVKEKLDKRVIELEIDKEIEESTDSTPSVDAQIDNQVEDVLSVVPDVQETQQPIEDGLQIETTGQVPVQSETTGSQENAQEQPQAEPQETAQEKVVDPVQEAVAFQGFLTDSGKEAANQLVEYTQGKFNKRSQFEQFVETYNENNERKISPKEADQTWEAIRPKRQEELFSTQIKQLETIEDVPDFKAAALDLIDKTNLTDSQRNALRSAVETKTQTKFISQLREELGKEPVVKMTAKEGLKQQIKTLSRGVDLSKKFIKENVIPKLKGVNLTPRQRGAILSKLSKANILFDSRSFDAFVDKVVDDSEYADKLAKAKVLKKRLAKVRKDKNLTPQEKKSLDNILAIDYEVADVDDYIEQVSGIVKPDVKSKKVFNQAQTNEYVYQTTKGQFEAAFPDQANTNLPVDEMRQRLADKEIADREEARRKKLLNSDLTEEELMLMTGEGDIDKATESVRKEELKKRLLQDAKALRELLPTESERQDKLDALRGIDLEQLSPDQLKAYIRAVDRVTINNDYDGLGNFLGLYIAQKGFKNIQKMDINVFGIDIGQKLFDSLPQLNKAIFGLSEQAAKFQLGFGIKGVSDAKARSVEASERFENLFKGMPKEAFDNTSVFRRGIYENLITYDKTSDVDAQFQNNKKVVEQTIKNYRNNRDNESADILENLYQPFKNAANPDEVIKIMTRIDPLSKSVTDKKIEFFKEFQEKLIDYNSSYFNEETLLLENYSGERKWVKTGTPVTETEIDPKEITQVQAWSKVGKPKQFGSAKKRQDRIRTDAVVNFDTDNVALQQVRKISFEMEAMPYMIAVRENLKRKEDLYKLFGDKGDKRSYDRAVATYKAMFDEDQGAYFRFENSALNRRTKEEMSDTNKWFQAILRPLRELTYALTLSGPSQIIKQSTVMTNVATQLGKDFDLIPVREYFTQKDDIRQFLKGESVSTRIQSRAFFNLGEVYDAKTTRDFKTNLKSFVQSGVPKFFNQRLDSWWGGMRFTTTTDASVAEMSFLAFYKQYLKKEGIKFEGWQKETELRKDQVRQEARAYAKQRVDEMQNVSDPSEQSAYAKKNSAAAQLIKAYLTPYGTFSANAKARLYNSYKVLGKAATGKATYAQGRAALADIAGTTLEQATFHTASFALKAYVFGILFQALSEAIGAEGESEEEKKRKLKQFADQLRTNMILDNVPIILTDPGSDMLVDAVNELAFRQFNPDGLSRDKYSEKIGMPMIRFKSGNDFQDVLIDRMGMYGTPFARAKDVYETVDLASTGETEGKPLTEEEKTFVWMVAGIQGLSLALRLPADVSFAAKREANRIRRQRTNYERSEKER